MKWQEYNAIKIKQNLHIKMIIKMKWQEQNAIGNERAD